MGDLIRRLGDALLGQPTERQLATNCEEVEEVVTPRKPRKSPYRNVAWHRTGKWIAKIHLREHPVHGEVIVHLGYYTDPEDAARVVDVAKMILADLGILRKWDGQCNLDGEPPASAPLIEILQLLMGKKKNGQWGKQIITPEQARRILTPH